jgi:putative endonuclease
MTTGSWTFYMLRCRDNSLYSGITNNLEERVKKHNEGKGARYTASHRPVTLVYSESCVSELEARARETEVKRWPKLKKELLTGSRGE